jgi:aldose 1-epimerase
MSALAAATAGFLTIGSVHAADADRSVFGQMPDGTAVEAITLTNANGVSARVLSYGATLQSLRVPDRSGNLDDVVLGYDDFSDYIEHPQYFGSTVGRFANRIAGAQFVLDGVPDRR